MAAETQRTDLQHERPRRLLHCYDNVAMESWNHGLAVEAVHGERFATRAQATSQLFEYIEINYNRHRLHSSLRYFSPAEFELARVA